MSVVVSGNRHIGDVHRDMFSATDEIDESAQAIHKWRALSAPKIAMTFAKRISASSHFFGDAFVCAIEVPAEPARRAVLRERYTHVSLL